jgi:hypothetical protein
MPPLNIHHGSGGAAKSDLSAHGSGHKATARATGAGHAKRPAGVGQARHSQTLRGSGQTAKGPKADRYENHSD